MSSLDNKIENPLELRLGNMDLGLLPGHGDLVTEVASLASHLDALLEELLEVSRPGRIAVEPIKSKSA